MLLSEAKKEFKKIGCKLSVKSYSFGRSVRISRNGNDLPSIFNGQDHRNEWLDVINLKQSIGQVFDDNSSDKIYGFS